MSQSPRLSDPEKPAENDKGASQKRQSISAPMLLFMTALDTTWRAFVPTLGGVFLGIWVDAQFGIAPIGVIVCLVGGTILSTVLIIRQLINVRKPLR